MTSYVACHWDDVAFKPTPAEPKFCSPRCRAAFAANHWSASSCAGFAPKPTTPIIYPMPFVDPTPAWELLRLTHGETPEPPIDEWDDWTLELKTRSVDHYAPARPKVLALDKGWLF